MKYSEFKEITEKYGFIIHYKYYDKDLGHNGYPTYFIRVNNYGINSEALHKIADYLSEIPCLQYWGVYHNIKIGCYHEFMTGFHFSFTVLPILEDIGTDIPDMTSRLKECNNL